MCDPALNPPTHPPTGSRHRTKGLMWRILMNIDFVIVIVERPTTHPTYSDHTCDSKVDTNKFVKTIGGFYSENDNKLNVDLEFNSNYKNDSISKIEIEKKANWKKISLRENDLQGKWLMVGRVRNGNEQRRNLERPRKTMKFLINGYFQWIAFNTETFQFSGSGGGKYITKDGKYIESIEYFSRDDSKVGLNLEFDYELINKEWNHKGFSSKGDPLHEIWVKRK